MNRRRGVSALQWCVIAAAIGLAVIAGITLVGRNTNTSMTGIAEGMTNPAKLVKMASGGAKK